MKYTGIMGIALVVGLASGSHRDDLKPKGLLGVPLGTIVVIEGYDDPETPKKSPYSFRVTALSGQKLSKPVNVWLENRQNLPLGHLLLKGYEFRCGPPSPSQSGEFVAFRILESLGNKPK